jgi:S-adenosylmethionine decarboxylase proenzyme
LPLEPTSSPNERNCLGWHWLVDFYRCRNLPTDSSVLESLLVRAAETAGATVVQSCFHRFSPFGLSGVVVIAESHLAAHTWPEHQALCVDLFACSEKINAEVAIDCIAEHVQAERVERRDIVRGRFIG